MMALLCLFMLWENAASQSPYPFFDQWPLVRLNGGILACSDYQTAFYDDFAGTDLDQSKWDTYEHGNPLGGRFHCGAEAAIFTDDNVRVNNQLELTVKRAPGGQYQLADPSGQPFDAHCYEDIPHVTRRTTAGMVMMDQSLVFNLGRYEFKCKFPARGNVWSAIWMWHHDEIDIVDIGFPAKFTQNVFSEGYTASIQQAPCCPVFKDCDFCPTNHVDCSGADKCEKCGDPYWDCRYMSEDFRVVGCEWTPFKVSLYVDGVITGVVYRYYTLDKRPVDVDCGGNIPDVLVRENPAYIDIQGRGFRPEIWLTAEEDYSRPCTYDSCFDRCQDADLPATLTVKYVKIEERVYERIALAADCYELCENSQTPVCVRLETEHYNFIYDHKWAWGGPAKPEVLQWEIPGANATLLQEKPDLACFRYDGPDCSGGDGCKKQVALEADVRAHTGAVYHIRQVLTSPRPEVVFVPKSQGNDLVCLLAGAYCGPFQATLNGEAVDVSAEINCFELAPGCNPLRLTYPECGAETNVDLDQVSAMPRALFSREGTPVKPVNFLSINTVDFFYPEVEYPGLRVLDATWCQGGGYVALGNRSVQAHFDGVLAVLQVRLSVWGCVISQTVVLVDVRALYRISPNPSAGVFSLDIAPEMPKAALPECDGVSVPPVQPLRVRVLNAAGAEIGSMSLQNRAAPYRLPIGADVSPGIYMVEIWDANYPEPVVLPVRKE